jgi:hypothetical protein
MPRKSETDDRSECGNAGPSCSGDDAIGAVVVTGDAVQRRKLTRHVGAVEDDSGRRGQAADGDYVAVMVGTQAWSPHDVAARIVTRK